MKKLIFCLIAFATIVVASARDVGVKLQTTDMIDTYTVLPTMQHSDFTAETAYLFFEIAQVVETDVITLPAGKTEMLNNIYSPPVYCNPDYGSYRLSVVNSIRANRLNSLDKIPLSGYPAYILSTTRHVSFS